MKKKEETPKNNNEYLKGKSLRAFLKGSLRFSKLTVYSLWTALFSVAILFLFISFFTYLTYAKSFEKAKTKSNVTQNTFYDKEGGIIYESYGTKPPKKLPLNEIPKVVKDATLAAEDSEFYYHTAIDLRGIIRAAVLNVRYSEKKGINKFTDLFNETSYNAGGGSTITQQLVKNIYLTQERSFDRKMKEIVYSFELEKKWSKDKIFEEYLNNVYYGEQALGIENASQIYFGKSVKDLTLAEASMMAGLTVAPTQYSPVSGSIEEAKKRQEYVLTNMYRNKMISLEDAKKAANEPLPLKDPSYESFIKYPYFVDFVTQEIKLKMGEEAYDNGGIKVYTTLDPKKQDEAEKIAKDYIKKYDYRNVSNSSVVILDNKNIEISAMVGGIDWGTSKVNVSTSLRQPGSSFKPIVYTAGLLNGYSAASRLYDGNVNFGGIPPYRPKNYDGKYHGNVTLRNSLANSLNIPAVEMTKLVGVEKVIETAEKLGIKTIENDPKQYGLSIGLGSAEVKLLELTRAYSVFANEGKLGSYSGIVKVVDSDDQEVYTPAKIKADAIDPKVASIMTSILSDNNARSMIFGTRSPLYLKDRVVAAKTGTTDDYADSWTVGFTPSYTVGVWMGNNDHTVMRRVSGVEGAAYIWHDIMEAIHADMPDEKFNLTEGLSTMWINPKTGLPATSQRKPNLLEYFVPGTEPKKDEKFEYLFQFMSRKNYLQTRNR